MKVLVVEDSATLLRTIAHGLEKLGWAVDVAGDAARAAQSMASCDYDVAVLDVMLPGTTGLELLKRMRLDKSRLPVLILSARDRIEDRVEGLRLGADDYLVKPFALEELDARLQALVRRRYEERSPVIVLHGFEIDTSARRARRDGADLNLTASEYAVLEMMALQRGRVLSRQQILDRLRSSGSEVTSNVVEVLVSTLRRKIQLPGEPPVVRTRRGFGYVIE